MNMKFTITTDSVTTQLEAKNEDLAAQKFAKTEPILRGFKIRKVADLIVAAREMGGWAKVVKLDK